MDERTFAGYHNQSPEWTKAYIDYRRLKVQLSVVCANAMQQVKTLDSFGHVVVSCTQHSGPSNQQKGVEFEEACSDQGKNTSTHTTSPWDSGSELATITAADTVDHGPFFPVRQRTSNEEGLSFGLTSTMASSQETGTASSHQDPLSPVINCATVSAFSDVHVSDHSLTLVATGSPTPTPFHIILSNLPASHVKFFDMLDDELEKVESLYVEMEEDMWERSRMLTERLYELGIQHEMSHSSAMEVRSEPMFPGHNAKPRKLRQASGKDLLASNLGHDTCCGPVPPQHRRLNSIHPGSWGNGGILAGSTVLKINDTPAQKASPNVLHPERKNPLNPQGDQRTERELQKAIMEHYRVLEVLYDYRIVNLAGFRRVLNEYGKITKIFVVDAYMEEKVKPSAFASGAMIGMMLEEMECIFATQFEFGDRRKAIECLRAKSSKTHHASTFHSGLWLGLALPAIIWGTYLSFQEQTRKSLPSWYILLFIYSLLVVPVLLALLVGINIIVWAYKKIDYVSIFELDSTTKLDPHEYFQLPSFLLCTLAYAFWFSMAQIGPPLQWPLIWFALTFVVMVNPFRKFMWGRARWWTIKHIARLATSGIWKVKFRDVWLGDQICSLDYSIANLYFVGCSYSHFFVDFASSNSVDSGSSMNTSFNDQGTTLHQAESSFSISSFQSLRFAAYDQRVQDVWSTCSVSQNPAWYYFLGMLPFMARFVQSLRHYRDSKDPLQLINAGKYMTGIISYIVCSYWKHQGSPHAGTIYFLWCFTETVNSIYSCAWDSLMDWSLCESDARYPLLREELVYKSQIPCYYFALVSNLCIRFIWLNYAILDESQVTVFVFIAALLEMLRRVQWNFYRLENQHLRNVRQVRITHKITPSCCSDEHSDEEVDEKARSAISWLKQQVTRVKKNGSSERSAV